MWTPAAGRKVPGEQPGEVLHVEETHRGKEDFKSLEYACCGFGRNAGDPRAGPGGDILLISRDVRGDG